MSKTPHGNLLSALGWDGAYAESDAPAPVFITIPRMGGSDPVILDGDALDAISADLEAQAIAESRLRELRESEDAAGGEGWTPAPIPLDDWRIAGPGLLSIAVWTVAAWVVVRWAVGFFVGEVG